LAQASEKQFDLLLGLSRKMEQSLDKIAKSKTSSSDASGNISGAGTNLASIALSVNTIVKALSVKEFKKVDKNANTIISFVGELGNISQSIKPQNIKSLGDMASGISSFISTLSSMSLIGLMKIKLFGKVLFSGSKPLLQSILGGIITSIEKFDNTQLKKVQLVGNVIAMIATGIGSLVGSMAKLALVAVFSPLILVGALAASLTLKMFISIGKNAKDIEAAGFGIKAMGKGIALLAGSLAMMALLITLVPVKTFFTSILVIAGFSATFALIGKMSGVIRKGAKAIEHIGKSLIVLSAGIAMISLIVMLVPLKDLLSGMLLIAGYALVFAIAGEASKYIAEGALSVIFGISLGLFFFAGALLVFSMAINKIGMGDAFLGITLLFGFGALFTLAGELGPFIKEGAFAIGAMGAGLAVFSLGMLIFSLALKGVIALFKNDWETAALATVGIIGGLGLAFAGIGLLSPFILLGSLAITGMGISLIMFSVGMTIFALTTKLITKMDLYDEKTKEFKGTNILISIAKGISSLALYAIPLFLGLPIALLLGTSLLAIGIGLSTAANAVAKIPDSKLFNDKLFGDNGIIPALANGFAAVSKKFGGGGFLGALKSFTGTDPVSMGMRIVKGLGSSLSEVAGGIAAFANFSQFPIQRPDPKDPSRLSYTTIDLFSIPAKITKALLGENGDGFLMSISKIFSDISDYYGGSTFLGTLKLLTGTDPVTNGINIVKGLGSALSEISGGIAAFANFEEFPVQIVDPKDSGKLIYKAVNLFTVPDKIKMALLGDGTPTGKGFLFTLANVFAQISKAHPKGFLWGDSDVTKGANAVKEIGTAIGGIAQGIIAFGEIGKPFPVEFDKDGKPTKYATVSYESIKANIIDLINILPDTFAKLNVDSLKDAQKKADQYKGISEVVASIADSLVKVKALYPEKEKEDFLGKFGTSLGSFVNNINGGKMLNDNTLVTLNSLATIFERFGALSSPFKTFTDAFASFATSTKTFSDNFSKMTPHISKYEKFAKLMNSQAMLSDKYNKFAPSFTQISKDMKTFGDNFKIMDKDTISAFEKWTNAISQLLKNDTDRFDKIIEQTSKLASNAANSVKGTSVPETPVTTVPPSVSPTINQPKQSQDASRIAMLEQQLSTLTATINNLVNGLQTAQYTLQIVDDNGYIKRKKN